jgi:hypothetical protein
MLARFSRLHHGFDLMEGNIHDQDIPFSTKLEMSNPCKRPLIQALPLHPISPGGVLLELHASINIFYAPPSSLMDSIASSKVKTSEGEKVGACSLGCNTLGVEGRAGVLGWGLRRLTSELIIHMDLHKLGLLRLWRRITLRANL